MKQAILGEYNSSEGITSVKVPFLACFFFCLRSLHGTKKLARVLHHCDMRFLGCPSSLTLAKCVALRWTNRKIIDQTIRITEGRNGTKAR